MSSVITALTDSTTGLTASKILGVVSDLVPFLVMIIPVALGIYFFRKMVKGTAKGKVKM